MRAAAARYGSGHQRERRKYQARLDAGEVIPCARCDQDITMHDEWDLGHTDDGTAWTGPECVPCNRSAGGRNGAHATNAKRQQTINDW